MLAGVARPPTLPLKGPVSVFRNNRHPSSWQKTFTPPSGQPQPPPPPSHKKAFNLPLTPPASVEEGSRAHVLKSP